MAIKRKNVGCSRGAGAGAGAGADTGAGAPAGWRTAAIAVVVAALAMLPYLAPMRGGTFINFDDPVYVTENPNVRGGLSAAGIRWAFGTFHGGNWHPLTWVSHLLDVSLFGLDPRGHHATSVLLYGLTAALLFVALRRLSGALWRSAFAAGLFAAHPLHVESVAWVAERKDVLAGLFFVLVLLAYERYARRPTAGRYGPVALLLACGLMAKPMLVTVPLVLLLLDYWPLGRARRPARARADANPRAAWTRPIVEKLPLLGLSVAASVITVVAQRASGAVASIEAIPAALRVSNALLGYLWYLGKTVWPHPLALYYPIRLAPAPWWQPAAALLVLAALSVAALLGARRRPFLLVGWCWFLGMLVPVIGLVQVGLQGTADRYAYLPTAGLFIAFAWGLAAALRDRRVPRIALAALAGALLALGAARTAAQAGLWRDEETLFRSTLAATSDNWLINGNLGGTLIEKQRFAEAAQHLAEAVRIRPDQPRNWGNYGLALASVGRPEEAIAAYRRGIQPGTLDAKARSNNARVWSNLGLALSGLGRREEALAACREGVALAPDNPSLLFNLGVTLAAQGRSEEAIATYRSAIALCPDCVDARNNLGVALARAGRRGEAIAAFRESLAVRPGNAATHVNLGLLLWDEGRRDEAVARYREALRLDPGLTPARLALARALEAGGRRETGAADQGATPR